MRTNNELVSYLIENFTSSDIVQRYIDDISPEKYEELKKEMNSWNARDKSED